MRPLTLLATLLLPTLAAAQVPPGHYAVSTFASGRKTPGGVFLIHPRIPGPPTRVLGLSQELTGPGTGHFGANAIAVRPDGTLLVGEIGPGGTDIDLHWIVLNNNRVSFDFKTRVGRAAGSFGAINQITPLPDGTALLVVTGIGTSSPLLIVDPIGRTVRPVPMSRVPRGIGNAVGVNAAGTTAYFGMVDSGPSTSIYRIPIPGGGTPVRVGTSRGVPGIAVDHRGRLVHGAITSIVAMDPNTGGVTSIGATGSNCNAVNLERVTDQIVYALNDFGPEGAAVKRMTQAGTSTTLTNALTGVPSGISVRHNPARFGIDTPGNAFFRWQVEPNPGGLPRVGNASFSVSVVTSRANPAGLLFVSPVEDDTRLLGVRLFLRPSLMFFAGLVPTSGRASMGIANNPALVGATLFFQSFHPDTGAPNGIAATSGLRVSVMR